MDTIYFDNAATTPMSPEVVEAMQSSMLTSFGNPSSVHQFGRKAKVIVEKARKSIAKHFNAIASEITFTSSGTEANNMVLYNAVENLGVKRIITSKIEHHAVLHVVEALQEKFNIDVVYVKLNKLGQVDFEDLESLLKDESLKTLVSLMMVNNEIGNILPIKEVSFLCKKYGALFHSDTVQAVGHYQIDLKEVPVDFIVASAHKFHGPKGVGFVYCNRKSSLKPIFYGGGQERGIRSGTENVHAILGMDKALEISYENLSAEKSYVLSLKKYFIQKIQEKIKGISFNGASSDEFLSTYTLVNVNFPVKDSMLLFNLDMKGVAVSSGSACSSGAPKGSHVLQEILFGDKKDNLSIRFSFSKMNSTKEIDLVLNNLISFLK